VKTIDLLAELVRERNTVDEKIVAIIERPAHTQHIAEYVAAAMLDIELERLANNQGYDGHFLARPLAGLRVNIKYSSQHNGTLDLPKDAHLKRDLLPDYYLALRGPKSGAISSRGKHHPFVITSVFLFETQELLDALCARGVKIGVSTSVYSGLWKEAEIYPVTRSAKWVLSEEQKGSLDQFRG